MIRFKSFAVHHAHHFVKPEVWVVTAAQRLSMSKSQELVLHRNVESLNSQAMKVCVSDKEQHWCWQDFRTMQSNTNTNSQQCVFAV
jgi:hypothetical protein